MRYVLAPMLVESQTIISTPPSSYFEVVFEDKHLLILNKAPGILSQDDGEGTISLVGELGRAWGRPYVGVVHRLDRNTSGLMVYAKRSKAASRLAESLRAGGLKRKYRALLWGELPSGQLEWRDLLIKDEQKNVVRIVARNQARAPANAKEAILRAEVIEQVRDLALVEFELETGRSHQIRVQSASRGFPLLGDQKYDQNFSERKFQFSRPALHSSVIEFPHPMDAENLLRFEAPWSQDMKTFWKNYLC